MRSGAATWSPISRPPGRPRPGRRCRATGASDADLVGALGVLWDGVELGDPEIVIRPVTAAHQHGRLVVPPAVAPVRLRMVRRKQIGHGSMPPIDAVRAHVARDLAADLARLLGSGATLRGCARSAPGTWPFWSARNQQAAIVRDALQAQNIPAVVAGPGSVFVTDGRRRLDQLAGSAGTTGPGAAGQGGGA